MASRQVTRRADLRLTSWLTLEALEVTGFQVQRVSLIGCPRPALSIGWCLESFLFFRLLIYSAYPTMRSRIQAYMTRIRIQALHIMFQADQAGSAGGQPSLGSLVRRRP